MWPVFWFRLWEHISSFSVTIADCYKKRLKGDRNNTETKAKGEEAPPLIIFTKKSQIGSYIV